MPVITRRSNEGGVYTPLPKGTYRLRVDEVKEHSTDDGHGKLQLNCVVVEGPQVDKKVVLWQYMSPKAMSFLKQLMDACDVEYEDTDNDDPETDFDTTFDTDEFLNKEFLADAVVDTEYDNNKWSKYRPVPGSGSNGAEAKSDDESSSEEASAPAAEKPKTERRRRVRR